MWPGHGGQSLDNQIDADIPSEAQEETMKRATTDLRCCLSTLKRCCNSRYKTVCRVDGCNLDFYSWGQF